MKRSFNTTGPCVPGEHYMLAPEARCPNIMPLIEGRHFFVLHAARQTGKTTLLQSVARELSASNRCNALYCSLESAQGFDDPNEGIPAVLATLESAVRHHPAFQGRTPTPKGGVNTVLKEFLGDLASASGLPLVVLFDEADCLGEGTVVTFLRQLRDGYVTRAEIPFVSSLALVGMRNLRDYRAHVREHGTTMGSASPFNVAVESVTLRDFSRAEVAALYRQHTDDTGQEFPPGVVDWVYEQTRGQPWLVNAIARELVVKLLEDDTSRGITVGLAEAAAERIVRRRDTHIDSLLERLREERVRSVIEPMLLGEGESIDRMSDDFLYVRDLGLIRDDNGGLTPANPLYGAVIARALNYNVQMNLSPTLENRWMEGGRLDMDGLLKAFQEFWRENSEAWVERFQYKEAAPHLILMAFLQRVLNGGARLDREFATGTRRVDLCVTYAERRYPMELKILRGDKSREEALAQLAGYMDRLGSREGWLVLFDRSAKAWDRKITWESRVHGERTIHVVGC